MARNSAIRTAMNKQKGKGGGNDNPSGIVSQVLPPRSAGTPNPSTRGSAGNESANASYDISRQGANAQAQAGGNRVTVGPEGVGGQYSADGYVSRGPYGNIRGGRPGDPTNYYGAQGQGSFQAGPGGVRSQGQAGRYLLQRYPSPYSEYRSDTTADHDVSAGPDGVNASGGLTERRTDPSQTREPARINASASRRGVSASGHAAGTSFSTETDPRNVAMFPLQGLMMAKGGRVKRAKKVSTDLLVPGGLGGGDRVPALLESGEVVLPKEQVAMYGGYKKLERDRKIALSRPGRNSAVRSGMKRYAKGGRVITPHIRPARKVSESAPPFWPQAK